MTEENKRILGEIRNDPIGVKALAKAISHANHHYNGTGREVSKAVVEHIKRDYDKNPEEYLAEIRQDPNVPLHSHHRYLLGLLD